MAEEPPENDQKGLPDSDPFPEIIVVEQDAGVENPVDIESGEEEEGAYDMGNEDEEMSDISDSTPVSEEKELFLLNPVKQKDEKGNMNANSRQQNSSCCFLV